MIIADVQRRWLRNYGQTQIHLASLIMFAYDYTDIMFCALVATTLPPAVHMFMLCTSFPLMTVDASMHSVLCCVDVVIRVFGEFQQTV